MDPVSEVLFQSFISATDCSQHFVIVIKRLKEIRLKQTFNVFLVRVLRLLTTLYYININFSSANFRNGIEFLRINEI